jgi:outer membrane immunogenic protein
VDTTTNVRTVEFGVNYKFNSSTSPGAAPILYPKRWLAAPINESPSNSYPYDWTGFYLGSDGGYGRSMLKGTLTDTADASLAPYSYGVSGPLAGLFVGGNYQLNKWVIGAEGDWQWSNLIGNDQTLAPVASSGAFPTGPFMISTTVKDYASIRGRLGIAFDRFFVFGTGGWAWGNPSTFYALIGAAPFMRQGGYGGGWSAGLGVDYALTNNVFGRIEYRYTNFTAPGFVSAATNFANAANRIPLNDLRAGIAYKFGDDPVFARF